MKKTTKVLLAVIAAVAILGVAVFYRGGNLQGKLTPISSDTLRLSVKPAADSPNGFSSAVTNQVLAKVIFSASDVKASSENYATLKKFRIRVASKGVCLYNLTLYPLEKDLDAYYAVKGNYANGNVEFDLSPTLASTIYDDIVEANSRTYVIRGDVTNNTNTKLVLKIVKFTSVTSSDASSYGKTSDILWVNGVTGEQSTYVMASAGKLGLDLSVLSFPAATGYCSK